MNENQNLGALAYAFTVIPSSLGAAGFSPIALPLGLWLLVAALGGVLGGAMFWEHRRVAGAIAFGLAGALSPVLTGGYVAGSMQNASPYSTVEFSIIGLFAPSLGLLLGASLSMLVWNLVANRMGRTKTPPTR